MNYRIPKKDNTPRRKSIEGFLPNNQSLNGSDVRQRFSQHYRPARPQRSVSDDVTKIPSVGSRRVRAEGFNAKNGSIQPAYEANDMFREEVTNQGRLTMPSFEPVKPKKRRFLLGKKKKKQHKGHLFKRLAIASFLIAVLGVGSLFGYGYLKTRQIFRGSGEGAAALQKDVDPARLNGEGDGRVNILLLGKGGPGHEGADLTDSILLASIDPIQNEAALISLPRDFYVKDQSGYESKINEVYANAKQKRLSRGNGSDADKQAAEDAGLQAVMKTVSDVLGVPVHYYVMTNFKAFEDAINTVGGITINVEEPLYDASMAWLLNGNPVIADKGLQTFNGKRALLYARSRKGSARGDFDRNERQKQVIIALQSKVMSLGTFSNPFKVVDLLGALGDNVRTDLNGVDEIKRLYDIGKNIGADKIASLNLADPPQSLVGTSNIGGLSVVVPTAGLFQYDDIHSFVRNSLKDPFLKKENARVVILNGTTTTGLASGKERELKSYGYNVVMVDNAPTKDYTSTRLIDNTNGAMRYTKSYLEKRIGKTAETTQIPGVVTAETADFVIILGSDEALRATN
jgi:polyisoprenyl-teichoic acid--peptidoglycan teichoic acid transferase